MTTVIDRPVSDAPHPAPHRPARVRGRHARPAAPATIARGVLRRTVRVLGSLVLVLAALSLLAMSAGPRVFHYRTASMLTGSMVPTINPGDVIVDTQEPVADLRLGQIITYHIPVDDHHVESHRVVWLHHNADGSVSFRTKGDANNGNDPWTAKSAAHTDVWIVRNVVPVVGKIIRLLRLPAVSFLLTRILPGLLVLSILYAIWRPSRRPPEAA